MLNIYGYFKTCLIIHIDPIVIELNMAGFNK